ncbi:hypothetical protein Tco_0564054 [Tanacetum coccineum]
MVGTRNLSLEVHVDEATKNWVTEHVGGLIERKGREKQFFSIDFVQEEDKAKNVSIHVYDRTMAWHLYFMRNNGDNVSWPVYVEAILKRFGGLDDDPMAELKNLSHKCSGQLFTLEVLGNMDEGSEVEEEEEFVECEELRHDCNEVIYQYAPHISLNALSGVPNFNIIRIKGMPTSTLNAMQSREGSMEDSGISLEGLLQDYYRPYRYPPAQKNEIDKMVKKLLDSGAIRLSNSPFSSPIVMVKKKDGS